MRVPARKPQPWEKQIGESREAFAAFVHYRDMEGRRSILRTADDLGKNRILIERWSKKWSWRDRAHAWDDQLDYEVRLAKKSAIIKANLRHASLARSFQDKIVERMAKLNPNDLAPHNLPSWLQVAVATERQALGMAANVTELQEAAKDPNKNPNVRAALADPEIVAILDRLNQLVTVDDQVVDEQPAPD